MGRPKASTVSMLSGILRTASRPGTVRDSSTQTALSSKGPICTMKTRNFTLETLRPKDLVTKIISPTPRFA